MSDIVAFLTCDLLTKTAANPLTRFTLLSLKVLNCTFVPTAYLLCYYQRSCEKLSGGILGLFISDTLLEIKDTPLVVPKAL